MDPVAEQTPHGASPTGGHGGPDSATTQAARLRSGLIFAFLAFAAWGLLSPLGKRLLDTFDPLYLNAIRFALAVAVLAPFLGRRGWVSTWRVLHNPWIVLANVLANVSLGLYVWSLQDLPAAVATLTFYAAPIVTAVAAHILLGEKVGWLFGPVSALVVGGGYLALFGLGAPSWAFPAAALALAFLSTTVWAGYSLAMRKASQEIDSRGLVGASFVVGLAVFALAAPLLEPAPDLSVVPAAAWQDMALYVLFPTLASLVLYTLAIQRAPAGPVNLWVGAELAFTFLFAWLLLGETYGVVQLLGAGVVLVAVTVYTVWRSRPQVPSSKA